MYAKNVVYAMEFLPDFAFAENTLLLMSILLGIR